MNKKYLLVGIIILLSCTVTYLTYLTIKEERIPSEEPLVQGKDISKEEYVYKEDLLNLGYTIEEIKTIEKKISNINVKQLLLNKKYDNLINFISSPYFNVENIERYEKYYGLNPDYTTDEVVIYVEIGLDNGFYTNINEIENYYDITTLVNKYNKLPDNVIYEDLIELEKPYSKDGKRKVRSVVYDSIIKMIDDAKIDNVNLKVVSAYRTNSEQNYLFNNSTKKNGLEHALLYSAKPGHSEHQLGLAIDLNSTNESFEKTKEYEWLKQNAYKYGFIERYPKGKEFITGYGYEPWHYRYLGIDIATKIYEEDITYEEYLIKYNR
ncbi:MAG: M15 family metallopeptidase [Bacilli bacterium]|nr:M15 family metallopeptidase [Bacilli bacterium]